MSNWEPVGKPQNDGWELVGTGAPTWEGTVQEIERAGEAVKGAYDKLPREVHAGLGAADFVGSMVSKAPGFIYGGLTGALQLGLGGVEDLVGLKPGTIGGADIHGAVDTQRSIMEKGLPGARFLKGYVPTSEYGKVAEEAFGHARNYVGTGMHQPIRNPRTGVLEWRRGEVGPGVQTLNEAAFDIAAMLLPAGGRGKALSRAERGIVEREALRQDQAKWDKETIVEQPNTVPYKDARLAPELEQARIEGMQDNTRTTDMRSERPTIDFPFRQEALEKDQRLYDLRDKYENAKTDKERQTAVDEASLILKRDYNVTAPDQYIGSMWMDKPQALPIRRSGEFDPTLNPALDIPGLDMPRRKGSPLAIEKTDPRPNESAGRPIIQPEPPRVGTVGPHGSPMDHVVRERERMLRDPFKGPGKGQAGAINIRGLNLNMKTVKDLPESLRNWVVRLADAQAWDRLTESGVEQKETRTPEVQKEYNQEMTRLLNDPDFIKQAVALSEGWDPHTMGSRPELPLPSTIGRNTPMFGVGPGKKQQGMLRLNDPEFLKFKDSLPHHMKGRARAMWRDMKKRGFKPKQDIVQNEGALATVDKIPGIKRWRDEIAPITKTFEELKPEALKEQDVPGGWWEQFVSGAPLYGFGTQNTVVRMVAQTVETIFLESAKKIDQLILNKDTGMKHFWEKLSKDEQGVAWSIIMAHEGKFQWTRRDLFEMGMTEKQVNAAMRMREVLNQVFDEADAVRISQGREPLERRIGYIPARNRGDWAVEVRDGDGYLVATIRANNKRELPAIVERAKVALAAKYPDLQYLQPEHQPMHRFKDASDVTEGYRAFLDILEKDDPRVAELESVYVDWQARQAYEALGVRKHFLAKRDEAILGHEGNKPWEDAKVNAEEGLRSVMNYVDHVVKWVEWNKNMPEMSKFLKDKEIQDAQPNAVAYAHAYINNAIGRSTKLARHIDGIVDSLINSGVTLGIGQSQIIKGIRETKTYVIANYLGVGNPGFAFSQLVQVIQAVPAWQKYFQDRGARSSSIMAFFLGAQQAIIGTVKGVDAMSPLARDAWNYAKEYGVVEPKILEDIRGATGKEMNAVKKFILFYSMTKPEKIARAQAYLSWVHFLDRTGEFPAKQELFRTAADLTYNTMVDYRQQNRAMIYNQAGIFGELANALTTYKHNYYSQLWALNERTQASRKTPRTIDGTTGRAEPPAGYMWMARWAAAQLLLAGALGITFREDIDSLIKAFNALGIKRKDVMAMRELGLETDKSDFLRIPTTRELIMEMPDLLAFGGVSALTGLDWSSKFSQANVIPDNLASALSSTSGTVYDVAEAGVKLARDPSWTNAGRLAHAVAPNSLKVGVEAGFQAAGGAGTVIDPETTKAKYKRDKFDWFARSLALRSTKEARDAHKLRTEKERTQYHTSRRGEIMKSAKDALFEKNWNKLHILAGQFIRSEGDATTFVTELEKSELAKYLTERERMLLNSVKNPRKFQRLIK